MAPELARAGSIRTASLLAVLIALVAPACLRASGNLIPLSPQELAFRTDFGLDTGADVLPLIADLTSERYGVRLTAAEESDIDERIALQDDIDPLTSWVQARPAEFGGVWLDQTSSRGHGFVVVIQSVAAGATNGLTDEIESILPPNANYRIDPVNRSLEDLSSLARRVEKSIDALRGVGTLVSSVQVDVRNNRVSVGIAAGSGDDIKAIDPQIFVHTQTLEPTICLSSETARCTYLPYRGGLQLLDGDLAYYCTSGFWTKKSSIYYFITAAHCWRHSLDTDVWRYSDSTGLGYWVNDSIPGPGLYCSGTTCYVNSEAAYLHVNSALVPSSGRNLVYRSSTYPGVAMTSLKTYANVVQGNAVCKVGLQTLYTCGVVTGKGGGLNPGGSGPRYGNLDLYIYWAIYTDAATAPGDSGGSAFAGSTAFGTVSFSSSGHAVLGSISYEMSDMGLTLCQSSAC